LVNNILAKELLARLHRSNTVSGRHDDIEGIKELDKAIIIDQSPIGRTPRSNSATYTGLFTPIGIVASVPESRLRGYSPGRFSFNVKGGRCENCAGDGIIQIEMHFLPDVYITCEVCHGKRYNAKPWKSITRARISATFWRCPASRRWNSLRTSRPSPVKLQTLVDVGWVILRSASRPPSCPAVRPSVSN